MNVQSSCKIFSKCFTDVSEKNTNIMMKRWSKSCKIFSISKNKISPIEFINGIKKFSIYIRLSSVRRDKREIHQSQGLKRKIVDQTSPSQPVSNLQYRTARTLPIYRLEMFLDFMLRRGEKGVKKRLVHMYLDLKMEWESQMWTKASLCQVMWILHKKAHQKRKAILISKILSTIWIPP